MAWALLDRREKRNAWIVVAVVMLSALSASAMVVSVMPFLSVLSDPTRIQEVGVLSWLYDRGRFESARDFLFALGIGSIVVIVVANTVQIVKVYVVNRYALMRGHTISFRLLAIILRQPYAYFLNHHSGEMGTQVLSESQQVVSQFILPATEVFSASTTIVALTVVLLIVDPVIASAVFAVVGTIYGGALVFSRRMVGRLGKQRSQANSARYRIANEALGGVRDIKLLGREWTYLDRYNTPSRRMSQSMAQVTVIRQFPQYVMQALAFSGLILLCLVLMGSAEPGGQVMADIVPTIGLIAFAGMRMIPELSRLFQGLTGLTFGGAAVQAVHDGMTTLSDPGDMPRIRAKPLGLARDIVFDAVSYHYAEGGKLGLSDVSLRVKAGERIGVVGSTGAGKSTLANILLGLITPTEGNLVVDGQIIDDNNVRAWQLSLGYVPQEIFLIDASVRENIAMGVPPGKIDDARVIKAAQTACVHDFVMTELDQGYSTEVGERGVRLSGGQRQRVGIARALYEDATFILLDEATSALDSVTETEVMQAIDALPGDKTIVMIAHRLSTLRGCDRILVMDQGRIAAFAPWATLEAESALFRRLAQTEGVAGTL